MTTQQQAQWIVLEGSLDTDYALMRQGSPTFRLPHNRYSLAAYLNALEDVAEVLPDVRDVLLMDRNSIDAVQSAVKRADAALARLEEARRG